MLRRFRFAPLLVAAVMGSPSYAADPELPSYLTAEEAGPDYQVQGEYLGKLQLDEGKVTFGIQVIALGNGAFHSVVYRGGLPGEGWSRGGEKFEAEGELVSGVLVIRGEHATGRVADGVLTVSSNEGTEMGRLMKLERKSPTLGAKPPAGAIVLFNGKNADAFVEGKMTGDLLDAGTKTKQEFSDYTLHLEFRTPFMPTARDQARGNSGVYLNDRYEVQVLDSFGLEGENNECGGFYSLRAPKVNMCFPPLAWQTYDVEFTSARYEGDEKKSNARVTVKHNGVAICENLELPQHTPGGADAEAPGKGPLMLQNHGNPVHFRNIWVVEKK